MTFTAFYIRSFPLVIFFLFSLLYALIFSFYASSVTMLFFYWSSICFGELGNHGYFSPREARVSVSQMNFLTSVSSISSCWYWWSCYLEWPEEGRFILRLLAALFLVAGLVLIRQLWYMALDKVHISATYYPYDIRQVTSVFLILLYVIGLLMFALLVC